MTTTTALQDLAAGRIPRSRIGKYVHRVIRQETDQDVGILSVETRTEWIANRDGSPGDYRIWWVEVAYPGGRIYRHHVYLNRRAGKLYSAEIN